MADLGFDPYGDPGLTLTIPPSTESSVGPERLVARTDKQAAAQALGKPLPVVIGTGRVEGIYFIGGVTQIDTTTTTTTWTQQDITEIGGGIYAGQVIAVASGPTGGSAILGGQYPIYESVDTSVTTSTTATKAGYVLAYDPFELGYDLIRLEIDGKCVYDVELGIVATATFRFYGGRQTDPDPILNLIIGANAGAYQNFVLLFLDGYPAESPPSISAVISKGTLTGMIIADFENGEYSTYGSPRNFEDFFVRDVPSDTIDHQGLEDAVVPGVGLSLDAGYNQGLSVTGEMRALILAGATVTYDVDVVPNPSVAANWYVIMDLSALPSQFWVSKLNTFMINDDEVSGTWTNMHLDLGSNKIAFTVDSNGSMSISVNGAEAETIAGFAEPTEVGLLMWAQGMTIDGDGYPGSDVITPTNMIMKKMTARAPVDNSELPALSSGAA